MNFSRFLKASSFFLGASVLGLSGMASADPNINISIDKTASQIEVAAGEVLEYTLEIENTGSVSIPASVSQVQDFASNEYIDIDSFTLTNINAADSCTVTESTDPLVALIQGKYIECILGAFNPGDVRTIVYTVNVLNTAPHGQDIVNTAYISTDDEESAQKSDNADSVTVAINNLPADTVDLSLNKSASSLTAQAGETLTYTLNFGNTGTGDAHTIVIQDFPDRDDISMDTLQVTNTSVGVTCQVTQSPDPLVAILQGRYLECTTSTLAAGASGMVEYTVQVDADASAGTMVVNTAQIAAVNETETNTNNSSSVSVEVVASAVQTDISLSKSVNPNSAQAGETVTYSLAYQNLGTESAQNVVIKDLSNKDELDISSLEFVAPLPAGVTCIVTQDPDPLVAIFQGSFIQCDVGTLAAGATGTIQYTIELQAGVTPGSTVLNVATINSTTTDPSTGNNSSTASLTVLSPGQSDISIQKTTPNAQVQEGATIPYTVVVTNTGDMPARNVVLKDISAGEKFDLTTLSLAGIDPNACEVKEDPDPLVAIFQGSHIECALPEIAAGTSLTINYTLQLNASAVAGDTITNAAQVSSGNETGTNTNNQDSATVTVVNTTVNGTCGTAAQQYASTVTSYGTDTFCASGTAPVTNPAFPSAGSSETWTCAGQNGGTDVTCTSSLQASATPTPTSTPTPTPTPTPTTTTTPTATPTPVATSVTTSSSSSSGSSSSTSSNSSRSSGSGGGCNLYATIDLDIKAFVQNAKGEYIDADTEEAALIMAQNTEAEVSYRVIILNGGSVSAYNAEFELAFTGSESLAQFDISNVQGAEYADGKFKASGKIPANGSYSVTFDATIDTSAAGVGKSLVSLTDFAGDYQCPKISSSEGIGENDAVYFSAGTPVLPVSPTPAPVVSSQPVTVIASTAEAYRLSKTSDKTEVEPGEEVTFTLSLQNTGEQDLKNVMLFDIFPGEYLEVVGNSTGNLVDPETLKFKRKFLPQEDTFTATVTMKVKDHVLPGTVIVNTVKAGSQTIEITDSAAVDIIVKSPAVAATKPTYIPQSNTASILGPVRLVQTGSELPLIPVGIFLLFAGIVIARRKVA